jgi:hypothetical protein
MSKLTILSLKILFCVNLFIVAFLFQRIFDLARENTFSRQSVVSKTPSVPSVVGAIGNDTLPDVALTDWERESGRRFDNAFVFLCHGTEVVHGQWYLVEQHGDTLELALATDVADAIHKDYPDRTVILVACNPAHIVIHDRPWLYYANDSVWVVPDRDVGDDASNPLDHNRWADAPGVLGNIFEFDEAD